MKNMQQKLLIDSKKDFSVRREDVLCYWTSKGEQRRWLKGNCYVTEQVSKYGEVCNDSISEVIATLFCEQLGIKAVEQGLCRIRVDEIYRQEGYYTLNFVEAGWEYIPCYDLLRTTPNLRLSQEFTPKQRLLKVLSAYRSVANLDATRYLSDMIKIDFLIDNRGRNTGNFGVLRNVTTNEYKFPPLFNFGLAMFEGFDKYEGASLDRAITAEGYFLFDQTQLEQLRLAQDSLELELGGCIRISEYNFPSNLAFEYVKYSCGVLGIELLVT